jgi:integrase
LRHAYGSRLASKGLSARQIADALGHEKTATTEIYLQRFNARGGFLYGRDWDRTSDLSRVKRALSR